MNRKAKGWRKLRREIKDRLIAGGARELSGGELDRLADEQWGERRVGG